MKLYEKWAKTAYDNQGQLNAKVWDEYLPKEQKFYEIMLETKNVAISGTVGALAKKYKMPAEYFCGLLDGIKEALNETDLDVENLTTKTEVNVTTDFERLYKKMVEYKAEHLYTLPGWNGIFTTEQLRDFYFEQKKSTTVVREGAKIGRNSPCPCGSGKKFKACCA